ncbi:CAP domain-containing protein [Methylomonas rhizoryzae]|uniref:CAP domain-containing protein n=1 Tax=Methylomonas rhizoryzae TaxID=2608981 RepID=UPI001231FD20|nr:CAP domain-containing protein [Methylomonas rhizoryzae]
MLGYLKIEGENVAAWSEYDESLFVDGWVESPSHYANIVNPNFTHTVIAVYTDPATGWAAATQLFWGIF